ncbi:DNA polymerase III subunit gamma/tau [Candidatus Pelagibacter sp.]|nr:DNA polymerase III subunit gamma/tau [Candidatus Pelagibacter sp.]
MTNKSKVLALKYRPQTFNDLIGHEEISNTIFNSIKINRSSNAYLFTGIRGIGKTTFARIVAKALNCENGVENLCETNFCSNCESIINSNHIDVLEMDAASKTGVEDVRELIEFSKYPPTTAKFKVFIIDEIHMLSKQAFNALLKTLEEPPKYLKFIFATTELKKIPITVISRCQRYDLSRITSATLFEYLKHITEKEGIKIQSDAIKFIVKISEGSVRDALSLLDRVLISNNQNLLSLDHVQKIFGYADKSSYIDLLESLFGGIEEMVTSHYRKIYQHGVDPSIFLNEFLEILYYVKNIENIKNEGTTFLLNDNDYKKIISLSKKISAKDILLFWEFTLKTIKEISIVNNPNLSIEMFLIQLMHITNKVNKIEEKTIMQNSNSLSEVKSTKKSDAISQIKNIKQEEEIEKTNNKTIKNFDELLKVCSEKKEMKLKYELENNVNLVSFSKNVIEISFNEKLNKKFVKDLSEKLFEWTGNRWIISFSTKKGAITKKDELKNSNEVDMTEFKKTNSYKELLKIFSDIELMDIKKND